MGQESSDRQGVKRCHWLRGETLLRLFAPSQADKQKTEDDCGPRPVMGLAGDKRRGPDTHSGPLQHTSSVSGISHPFQPGEKEATISPLFLKWAGSGELGGLLPVTLTKFRFNWKSGELGKNISGLAQFAFNIFCFGEDSFDKVRRHQAEAK